MIGVVRDRLDAWLGRGRHSTAVPVMDGALQPNQLLETAPVAFTAEGLDNLCAAGGALWYSAGAGLCRRAGAETMVERMAAPVSALAAHGAALAVGMERRGIVLRGGAHDGRTIDTLGGKPAICPTALMFEGADTLVVALGAEGRPPSEWKHDLMTHGRTGSVWRVALATGAAERIAGGLGWPYGVAPAADGALLVSEAWAHRILRLPRQGRADTVLDELPGYPARIIPATGGGWWLALFAPRNQLVEFVLREPAYRARMMAEVPPAYWIAPALTSNNSFLEPLQNGAVKQMGILKPWAPARSCGLVVRLDPQGLPVASWHSRADGRMHGVTSVAETEGGTIAGARGAGAALILPGPAPADRSPQ